MKLQLRDLSSGTKTLELDCTLETMGGTKGGVTFEARAGARVVVTSFTHLELCKIIMHYRKHCDIEEVMFALSIMDEETQEPLAKQAFRTFAMRKFS